MTKEEHEVPESSTRDNPGLRARENPDPAELTGGEAPPCAEPPVAPTLFSAHLYFFSSGVFDYYAFEGPIILSGLTHSSNCSSVSNSS